MIKKDKDELIKLLNLVDDTTTDGSCGVYTELIAAAKKAWKISDTNKVLISKALEAGNIRHVTMGNFMPLLSNLPVNVIADIITIDVKENMRPNIDLSDFVTNDSGPRLKIIAEHVSAVRETNKPFDSVSKMNDLKDALDVFDATVEQTKQTNSKGIEQMNDTNETTSKPTSPYKGPKHKPKQATTLASPERIASIKSVWEQRAVDGIKNPFGNNKAIAEIVKVTNVEIINPKHDGTKHINVMPEGITELGRILDLGAKTPFDHPDLGRFSCLSGLWYYLCAAPIEDFRSLSGNALRRFSKKYTLNHVDGFYRIMAEATWFKVMQNQKIIDLLIKTENAKGEVIPFNCYYLKGEEEKIPVKHKNSSWYVPILEEVRRVILINNKVLINKRKNEEEVSPDDLEKPNFDFCDKPMMPKKPRSK